MSVQELTSVETDLAREEAHSVELAIPSELALYEIQIQPAAVGVVLPGGETLIRTAVASDSDAVGDLNARLTFKGRLFRWFGPATPEKSREKAMKYSSPSDPNVLGVVAVEAATRQTIGYGSDTRMGSAEDGSTLGELSVVVDPEKTRRRLGTLITRAAVMRAKADGIDTLDALVMLENRAAQDIVRALPEQIPGTVVKSGWDQGLVTFRIDLSNVEPCEVGTHGLAQYVANQNSSEN